MEEKMEIVRKFLIKKYQLPADLYSYPCHQIEQVIYVQTRWCVSADRMRNIFSLTNQKVLWQEKSTIFPLQKKPIFI